MQSRSLPSLFIPTKYFATSSRGATVADKPIRVNTPAKFCNLSIESARCVPLLFDANA